MEDSASSAHRASHRAARDDLGDRRPIDRLRTLERLGVPLSRNRSFAVFSQPQNLAALRTHHYLSRLGRELVRTAADGRGSLRATRLPDGGVELTIVAPWLAARRVAFLRPDELAWMREGEGVAAVLETLDV